MMESKLGAYLFKYPSASSKGVALDLSVRATLVAISEFPIPKSALIKRFDNPTDKFAQLI